eukprot:6202549-Ditylum_brightwellii.AAC.1
MAATITSSCTRKGKLHEETRVVHTQKHNEKWVIVADNFKTNNDDESSSSSCSDSVPELQVFPVKVAREMEKKADSKIKCYY